MSIFFYDARIGPTVDAEHNRHSALPHDRFSDRSRKTAAAADHGKRASSLVGISHLSAR
jgi:hypothetical protein